MRVLILAGCLLLAACQTTRPAAEAGTTAPTSPKALCSPAVLADSEAEPKLPAALSLEAVQAAVLDGLGEAPAKAFVGWLVEFRGWGQAGWRRIDTARRTCPP